MGTHVVENMPKLVFPPDVDESVFWDIQQKSWCGCGEVVCPDGQRYEVTFFVPRRLQQELDSFGRVGVHWIGENALIIVSETTVPVMEAAVAALWKEGWFKHLKPIEQAEAA